MTAACRCRAAGLALAVAALAGCTQHAPATVNAEANPERKVPGVVTLPAGSPKLGRIHLQPVATREFAMDEIVVPGKVETNPHRVSRVTVPVAGRIVRVFVHLGEAVQPDQPLVAVDSMEAGSALAAWRQAQSQMRMANSTRQKAEADLSRLEELLQHRAAALKDVIAARNDLTQAQAALEQGESAREEARHRLQLLGIDPAAPSALVTVRSPIAGKVLEIAVVPGEFRNDTNAALMTIADLSTVWVGADVPESLIRLVRLGEALEVTLPAYPGEVFHARVMRVADVVDPQTRTVKVEAQIGNPGGRLRPEMFGQVRHVHATTRLPAVPAGAVLQLEGRNVVWVSHGNGLFRQTEVATGARQGDWIAIASGLSAGAPVVVDGATLLGAR